MLPALPAGWHLKEAFEIMTGQGEAYVRNLLLQNSKEDEIFIGYPLHAFKSPDGFECLCPVMLFPVEIAVRGAGYTTGLRIEIDRKGISLNQDWIEYHVPRRDQVPFRRACEQSSDEAGALDVALVLDFIQASFKSATIAPDRMQFSVRRADAKDSLLNTAALFTGTKAKYSKNLLSELRRIAVEPDAVLDKTALAYVFRNPPLPNVAQNREPRRIPVSFTKRPMNAGQFNAVEESLNNPLAKVTGPPGTGKSFMSVNLIANEVLHGGSVLFTSRNHKAIHAIFDKTPDAIEDKDFPLVSFCTTPDNPTNADWRKTQKDVDARVGLATVRTQEDNALPIASADDNLARGCGAVLDVALSAYRDAEGHIRHYRELRERIARCERALERIESLASSVPAAMRDAPETENALKEIDDLLSEIPKTPLAARIADWLARLLLRKRRKPDWRAMLADFAPGLVSPFVSYSTAGKEVRRLIGLLKFRALARAWEDAELAALRSDAGELNYDALKTAVGAALGNAAKAVQGAFIETLLARTGNVSEPDSLVARCADAADAVTAHMPLEFLSTVDDGSRYDGAVAAFREYLDVFPAWASTMLSLRRAAPCLPAVFSLAVIDEASQCDIPPMIPVLFRAERAAIIGDPNQFPPVITLPEKREIVFRRRYRVDGHECRKFAFREGSAFSVTPGNPLLLNEHFRCADGIAAYFNEEFYEGDLTLCCEDGRGSAGGGAAKSATGSCKPGMEWIDAPGGDTQEMEAAIEYLRDLRRRGYAGSIGVISPLRELANGFKTLVARNKDSVPSQLDVQSQISTANGFQGAECDVILFLLGLNESRSHGEEWYITAKENKYIFNVSVSRAKHLFVAFGDRQRVMQCGLPYIERLIPESRPPRKANVGPGEERLRLALQRAGIETVSQFPVLGRYLDLAIPEKKIDIEVDGQAWHLDRYGGRKADDIHRDVMLEAAGWRVVRVWHAEVVNELDACVAKIRAVAGIVV